ncbi:hypothetical protein AAIH32_12970 [Pseudarthrobacter oxydans]|uniref:hypothetical protein n=1 Tax=Pseudarthrobacter oxydans TaxID=1671 RepID=UPI003D27EC53
MAYSVVGAYQILVWNPLAAVPGATLHEIYAAMDRANESLSAPTVFVWAGMGTLLAVAVLIATLRQSISRKAAVVLYLLLLVMGAPTHMMASFPAGMGIADAFAISGGDHAPWGAALYTVSVVAFLALVFVGLRRNSSEAPHD